jgi:Fe-S-cluster-containing dehydrogenase component
MTQLAMMADLDRCTGCYSCVVACEQEYSLPPGLSFIRLSQVGPIGEFPDLAMYYLPLACQQCRRPSCAASCPEDAIGRSEDGVVAVATEKCTGCAECVEACPYGAILLDPVLSLAGMCDLCAEGRSAGRSPACVAACPGKALAIVDVDGTGLGADGRQPGGHERMSFALLPSLGNDPAARFVLARQEWRDSY